MAAGLSSRCEVTTKLDTEPTAPLPAGNADSCTKPDTDHGISVGVVAALVSAQCVYGCSSVVSRAWVSEGDGVGYSVFVAYRNIIGAALLWIGSRYLEKEGPGPPRHISPLEFLALSGLGIISSLTFLCAIGCIGSFLPALGETLVPVYVCIVCVIFQLEAVRRGKVAGVACAVAGALLVVAREETRKTMEGSFLEVNTSAFAMFSHLGELWQSHPTAVSMGLCFTAVHIVAAGNYWTLKKQLLYRASPLHLSAYANILSAFLALLVAVFFGHPLSTLTWIPTQKNMYALSFSTFEAVFGTGLTAWATKRTKATSVVASMTLQPLFSSFFSWVFLGAALQGDHAMGMVLTTCGLLLVAWSQANETDDPAVADIKLQSKKLLQTGMSTP